MSYIPVIKASSDLARPYVHAIGGVDVIAWNPVREMPTAPYPRNVNNFGDVLGPQLVYRIAGHGLVANSESERRPSLIAIGSVLHLAPEGATVWGSGANFKTKEPLGRHAATLDFRAVRGPLTARMLQRSGIEPPEVFGDPALLLPRFFPEFATWGRIESERALVVPNLNDYDKHATVANELGLEVLNPTEPTEHVLRSISRASFVIASSLHAVVVADALGVPARLVASAHEHPLKYRDYLAGSGRSRTRVAPDIATALLMGPHEPPAADLDALEEAFPYDLWHGDAPITITPPLGSVALGSWDLALDTGRSKASTSPLPEALGDQLQRLVTAAVTVLDSEHSLHKNETPETGAYREVFSAVSEFRATSGAEVDKNEYDEPFRGLVTVLDQNHPELGLRATWLSKMGPHVMGYLHKSTPTGVIMALSIRPGTLTNSIKEVTVSFRNDHAETVLWQPPVFDLYRRQWSIDFAFGLEDPAFAESSYWAAEVTLVSDGETQITLPLLSASRAQTELLAYPDTRSLENWAYESSKDSGDTKEAR